MLKRDELTNPNSCLNKASDDELLFVFLERDESAAIAVLAWLEHRIARGKNKREDAKIQSAEQWINDATKGKGIDPELRRKVAFALAPSVVATTATRPLTL